MPRNLSDFWREDRSDDRVLELASVLQGADSLIGVMGSGVRAVWSTNGQSQTWWVRQKVGGRAETRVFLDYAPLGALKAPYAGRAVDEVIGYAAHEGGHCLWSSASANGELLNILQRKSPAKRGKVWTNFGAEMEGALRVANILEDAFIDFHISETWPVLGEYIRWSRECCHQRRPVDLDEIARQARPPRNHILNLWIACSLYDQDLPQFMTKRVRDAMTFLMDATVKAVKSEEEAKKPHLHGLKSAENIRLELAADCWLYLVKEFPDQAMPLPAILKGGGLPMPSPGKGSGGGVPQKGGGKAEAEAEAQEAGAGGEAGKEAGKNARENAKGEAKPDTGKSAKDETEKGGEAKAEAEAQDGDGGEGEGADEKAEAEDKDGNEGEGEGADEKADGEPSGGQELGHFSGEPEAETDTKGEDKRVDKASPPGQPGGQQGGDEAGAPGNLDEFDVRDIQEMPQKLLEEVLEAVAHELEDLSKSVAEALGGLNIQQVNAQTKRADYDGPAAERVKSQVEKEISELHRVFDREHQVQARHLHGLTNGKLDTRRLARVGAGNLHVFKRREVLDRPDLAVGLLLDVSGSMSSNMPIVWATGAIFGEALVRKPGVNYLCLTYTGGMFQVQTTRICDRQMGRLHLGNVDQGGGTPSGPAIASIKVLMDRMREREKVIIHFTDGQPDDPYAVRTAVANARKAGYKVWAISLKGYEQMLASQYGEGNYRTISAVRELPRAVAELVKELVR